MIDTGPSTIITNASLENTGSGFLLYPFQSSPHINGYFIKNSIHFMIGEEGNITYTNSSGIPLTDLLAEEVVNSHSGNYHLGNNTDASSGTDYKTLVSNAITNIEEGKLKKVVLARNKRLKLKESFDPVAMFYQLCASYPNSFISLTSHPVAGTWIGASPEVLLSQNDTTFRTVALAATQHTSDDKALSQAVWTQKEIEEQALVSRYIINCFKKIRLREYEEEGPKTVKAGSLIHLKTDFSVDLKEVNRPELASVMLNLLHPTSAVCGMPKEEAKDYILTEEGLNRKYYSGFLGPVNMNSSTDLFVNIRCAQLLNGEAILYAGAGITAESDPEKEYQETEWKMKILEKFLA